MRTAVIGSGVAGLVAARTIGVQDEITVLEQNDYLGGHAHTVVVQEGPRALALDTGFIVFNTQNYPLFTSLLAELGVASQPSEMSFGVACRRCRLEYSSRGLRGLFARPSQLLRPDVYRMAAEIVRFNHWATDRMDRGDLGPRTVADLKDEGLFSTDLFRHYLVPMTGAIWSSTGTDVDGMPLQFLLSFYRNHGLLQTHGHPEWRTVTGGSQRYVEALARPFRDRVRLGTPARAIRRSDQHAEVRTDDGWERYDHVVLATHTDQALRLLEDPTPEEVSALSAIPYRQNEAILHTDDSVLATAPAARASWNCHVDDCRRTSGPLRMTYHLNRLQSLDTDTPYCVTLNDDGHVSPEQVIARMSYAHPLYTHRGLEARQHLRRLSGQRRTSFCGAYMGNGFHEDGVRAGQEVAEWVIASRTAA